MTEYRARPDQEDTGWPRGVPYIIGNEGCERFSFYGMKAILYVYLTYLLTSEGVVEGIADKQATAVVHTFVAGVYALPMVGAMIADRLLGKYQTIIWLSLVYCAGHACLALFDGNFQGFVVGLVLISVGSGGIKPCVSAHVGDQFGKGNWPRLQKIYGAFYFIINFGSMFSTIMIPWIKEEWGWSIAFAVPGVLMAIATFFFWMGRRVFVHVPPRPGGRLGLLDVLVGLLLFASIGMPMFGSDLIPAYAALSWAFKLLVGLATVLAALACFAWRQRLEQDDGFLAVTLCAVRAKLGRTSSGAVQRASSEAPATLEKPPSIEKADLSQHRFWGPAARRFGAEATQDTRAVFGICSVFLMVSVFWALFDQYASSWVEQAKAMDRLFRIGSWEFTILPEQVSAINPVLVMLLVPMMSLWGYPWIERTFKLKMTSLNRMTLGMSVAAFSFVVVALLQRRLDAGFSVHVSWQVLAFFIITLAEVMVSVTGLEFAYTQAPRRMKSLIMGLWLFTVSIGNELVAFLAGFENLGWEKFFWTFAGLMAVAALIFGIQARFYRYATRTQ